MIPVFHQTLTGNRMNAIPNHTVYVMYLKYVRKCTSLDLCIIYLQPYFDTCVGKGNFFFCHYVFKKPSATEASESIYMSERVKRYEAKIS